MGDRFEGPRSRGDEGFGSRAADGAARQRSLVDSVTRASGGTGRRSLDTEFRDADELDEPVEDGMLVEVDHGDRTELGVVRRGFRGEDTVTFDGSSEGGQTIGRDSITHVAKSSIRLFDSPGYDGDAESFSTSDLPEGFTRAEDGWDEWTDRAFAGQELYVADRETGDVRRATLLSDPEGGNAKLRIEGHDPDSLDGTAPFDETTTQRFAVLGGQDWTTMSRKESARAVAKNVRYNLVNRSMTVTSTIRTTDDLERTFSTYRKDTLERLNGRITELKNKPKSGGTASYSSNGRIKLAFNNDAGRDVVRHEAAHAKMYAYDLRTTNASSGSISPGKLENAYNDARRKGGFGQGGPFNADGTIDFDFSRGSRFGSPTDYMIQTQGGNTVFGRDDRIDVERELQARHGIDVGAGNGFADGTETKIRRGDYWTDKFERFEEATTPEEAMENFARAANRALYRQQLSMGYGQDDVRTRYSIGNGARHYSAVNADETAARTHEVLASSDELDAERAVDMVEDHPDLVAAYTEIGTLSEAVADRIGDRLDDMGVEYDVESDV